jgi:hypothetical protein
MSGWMFQRERVSLAASAPSNCINKSANLFILESSLYIHEKSNVKEERKKKYMNINTSHLMSGFAFQTD